MIHQISYPSSLKNKILGVEHKDNPRVSFAVTSTKNVETLDGPAVLVRGSSDSRKWADPSYDEFLLSVGSLKMDKGVGASCFFWRDKYWVRAVRPSRKSCQRYAKYGEIIQHILLEITLP